MVYIRNDFRITFHILNILNECKKKNIIGIIKSIGKLLITLMFLIVKCAIVTNPLYSFKNVYNFIENPYVSHINSRRIQYEKMKILKK